ncbi:MAG: hypothetical protein ACPG6P_14345 [Akkermansiaceae bacterium]
MDTKTGQIISTPIGTKLSDSIVPIDRLPDPKCPKCHGKGHYGNPTRVGSGKKAAWQYLPCECTKRKSDAPPTPPVFTEAQFNVIEQITAGHQGIACGFKF